MSAHRYWCIYGAGSGTTLSIGELQLRQTVGGSNVLSSPYSSLRADSFNGANTSYGTRKALDGATGFLSNCWRSEATSDPHWWMVDFGKKLTLAEAVMNTGPAGETRGSVKVQASNDLATWVDYGEFPPFSTGYQQQTITLSAVGGGASRRRPVIVCM